MQAGVRLTESIIPTLSLCCIFYKALPKCKLESSSVTELYRFLCNDSEYVADVVNGFTALAVLYCYFFFYNIEGFCYQRPGEGR